MMNEYMKIHRFGESRYTDTLLKDPTHKLYIEEKIDGANGRFLIENGVPVFGSHHQILGEKKGNFHEGIEYINKILEGKDLTKYEGLTFFGEFGIKHTINYTNVPLFTGYDIMDCDGKYIDFNDAVVIFNELGFKVVPVIAVMSVKDFSTCKVTDNSVPNSAYGLCKAEGIVIKNYATQTFLKYVCLEFKEVKPNFKERPVNDDEKLIMMYCVEPRINKKIHSLVNSGDELHMRLMQHLPKMVWEDIIEEHGREILLENWSLNLRNCKKMVDSICKRTLLQRITSCV